MGYLGFITSFVGIVPLTIGAVILIFYLRQKKAEQNTIPPLDLVDAKKLDSAVEARVQVALKPILSQAGYSDEDIDKILTRTSLLGQPMHK